MGNIIKKPKDSEGMNTTDIVSVMKELMISETAKGYHASYVVGVSFGTDLSKWREILREIFNEQAESVGGHCFNQLKKFDKAVLITDPVSITDRYGKEAIESDKLEILLRGTKQAYLHSKMILIALQKNENVSEPTKYVLLVSSKNITYSKSFDLVVTLFSQEGAEASGGSGKEILDYLTFLAKDDEKKEMLSKNLPNLENVKFDVRNEENEYEAHVTDIVFSYDGHKFQDHVWAELMKSTLVISPYLTQEQFVNWKQGGKGKKLLTYYNSADKIMKALDSNQKTNMPTIYVGSIAEEGGRVKFHAKLYANLESDENGDKYTRIWLGSANLTCEAKSNHWELLIGFAIKDNKKGNNSTYTFDHIKTQVMKPSTGGNKFNPLIELYQSKRRGEDTDPDEEAGGTSVGRMNRYALFQISGGYEWRIYNSSNVFKESVVVSRSEIGNWIVMNNDDETELFVCKDNYLSADLAKENTGYIKYEDYKKLVNENVKKKKGKYYRDILFMTNAKKASSNKRGRKRNGNSPSYIKYPCLYKNMMELSEKNGSVNIKEELSKLYYDFMDPDDADDNEIVNLMKAYVESLNEEAQEESNREE